METGREIVLGGERMEGGKDVHISGNSAFLTVHMTGYKLCMLKQLRKAGGIPGTVM